MTFAPVREAQRLWERTAPQLTFDLDALEESAGAKPLLRELTATHCGGRGEMPSPANPAGSSSAPSSNDRRGGPSPWPLPNTSPGSGSVPTPTPNTNGPVRKPSWASADGADRR